MAISNQRSDREEKRMTASKKDSLPVSKPVRTGDMNGGSDIKTPPKPMPTGHKKSKQ